MAWAIRRYYVTVKRDVRTGWLAGPYETHQEALDKVDVVSAIARKLDPWCDFDAFGTSSIERFVNVFPVGVLNSHLTTDLS